VAKIVLSPLCIEITKGLFTLAAAGFGAWIALRLYFRQKEYELIKQRYLEGAIDIVAAEEEQALGVVNHNWARCLNIVKAYRDEKDHFDVKELAKGFLNLDSSKMHRVPHHRIGTLTGSQLIWQVYQLAMAFAANSNTKITKEIPETIRLQLSTDLITSEPQTIANAMFEELNRIDDESHKFACLTRELHALGLMLETERPSFKSIAKFSKRAEVKDVIKRLERDFADELAHHDQNAA
jgi:hypothetical protein